MLETYISRLLDWVWLEKCIPFFISSHTRCCGPKLLSHEFLLFFVENVTVLQNMSIHSIDNSVAIQAVLSRICFTFFSLFCGFCCSSVPNGEWDHCLISSGTSSVEEVGLNEILTVGPLLLAILHQWQQLVSMCKLPCPLAFPHHWQRMVSMGKSPCPLAFLQHRKR